MRQGFRKSGFTLVEVVVVLTMIFILVSIGVWRLGQTRADANTVAARDVLATVQRMQQLADVAGVTVNGGTTSARLQALQAGLAAKGYANFKLNPDDVATKVQYSGGHWTLLNP